MDVNQGTLGPHNPDVGHMRNRFKVYVAKNTILKLSFTKQFS